MKWLLLGVHLWIQAFSFNQFEWGGLAPTLTSFLWKLVCALCWSRFLVWEGTIPLALITIIVFLICRLIPRECEGRAPTLSELRDWPPGLSTVCVCVLFSLPILFLSKLEYPNQVLELRNSTIYLSLLWKCYFLSLWLHYLDAILFILSLEDLATVITIHNKFDWWPMESLSKKRLSLHMVPCNHPQKARWCPPPSHLWVTQADECTQALRQPDCAFIFGLNSWCPHWGPLARKFSDYLHTRGESTFALCTTVTRSFHRHTIPTKLDWVFDIVWFLFWF